MSEPDKDKNTPKDKDKDKTTTKTKTKTKTEDKDKTPTKTKTEDNDKTTPKIKTKTEVNDKTMPKTKNKIEDKDEGVNKGRNKFIQISHHAKQKHDEKGNYKKRQIVWVFWDDELVSELCKKWICYNHEYAYTLFEELRTYSGEVLFTREHKAITSKDNDTLHFIDDKLNEITSQSRKKLSMIVVQQI